MGVCASQTKSNSSIKSQQQIVYCNTEGQERLTNQSLKLLPSNYILGLKRSSSTNQFNEIRKKQPLEPYDLQRGFHKRYSVLRIEDSTIYCQNNLTTQLTKVTILDRITTYKHSYFKQIQQHDLKSIYISQYIESYQERDKIYLVQEQLKGGNLSKMLKKKHLTYQQATLIIEQIINGVHHLHQQHLSHGQLTIDSFSYSDPDNLLVKLTDLGPIFHLHDPNELTNRFFVSQFASPENKKSAKSDVWSIGIIFYQLLTSEILEIPTDYADILNWNPLEGLNIPKEGAEGLKAMLQYDSHKRCTLKHIIEKGYFKSEINRETIIQCVIQLGQLKKMTNLQALLILFMMNKFHSEQVQILSRVFKQADQDQDGILSKNELKNLFHHINLEEEFINELVESIFNILDDRSLTQDIFVALSSNKKDLLVDYNIELTFKLLSNYQGGMTARSIGRQILIKNESEIRKEINEYSYNQFDLLIFSNYIKEVL